MMFDLKTQLPRLDLDAALLRAARSSDLIPERPEDRIAGATGKRFSEGLRTDLSTATYKPTPAQFILVPKRGFTTRPAAVLTLVDRVVYDALVATFEDRIEEALVDNVIWPRGKRVEKRWEHFVRHPVRGAATTHVVEADITGFYESIDHQLLTAELTRLTGRGELARITGEFLSQIMGGERGLPQGLDASDQLATAYLASIDAQARRAGIDYVRNGDDMRIACSSYSQAREALATLEVAVRSQGLLLNSGKTRIVRRETYEQDLAALDDRRDALRARLIDVRKRALLSDEEQLQEKLLAAGFKETAWAVWYHGTETTEEAIEMLREQLSPTDKDLAEALFRDTMEHREHLDDALFHQSLVDSIRVLQAMRSSVAIADSTELLLSYPDKAELVCRYLSDAARVYPAEVALALERYATDLRFRTDLEWAWVLRAASRLGMTVGPVVLGVATRLSTDENVSWVTRVEALRVRAENGQLDHAVWKQMYRVAPSVFRSDLVEAAVAAEAHNPWPKAVLDTFREDPVLHTLVAHARSRR